MLILSEQHSRRMSGIVLVALLALVSAGECPMEATSPVDTGVGQELNGGPTSNACGPASFGTPEEGSPLFTLLNCNLAPNGSVYCFTPACDNHDFCLARSSGARAMFLACFHAAR